MYIYSVHEGRVTVAHSAEGLCGQLTREDMYVYMYVCMYVCMYVRTYVCMYVCMYMYIYIYILYIDI